MQNRIITGVFGVDFRRRVVVAAGIVATAGLIAARGGVHAAGFAGVGALAGAVVVVISLFGVAGVGTIVALVGAGHAAAFGLGDGIAGFLRAVAVSVLVVGAGYRRVGAAVTFERTRKVAAFSLSQRKARAFGAGGGFAVRAVKSNVDDKTAVFVLFARITWVGVHTGVFVLMKTGCVIARVLAGVALLIARV